MNRLTRVAIFWVAMFLLPLIVYAVAGPRANGRPRERLPAPETTAAPAAALQDTIGGSRRNAIVAASQRVAPSVVSVNVLQRQTMQPRTLFESLYFPEGRLRESRGLGSGFLIRADGVVLTNEHVVRGATEVVVTLADGRDFAADIVGTDETTDLAVLQLRQASALPVAPLGTSSNLIIGEWAIAIGNPFGFYLSNAEPTVTAGVISGVGRNIIPESQSAGMYLDMIQTDASINPGNSGGPLVNALGQVIGVNSSILSSSGGSIGLGFAIPIDRARRIAEDLLTEKRVRRAWVGVTPMAAAPNQFGRSHRVQIEEVAPGSPAARAGLQRGDEIIRVAGRAVSTPLDWEARLIDARIGQPLDIVVTSGGRQRTVRVTPQAVPSLAAQRVSALSDEFELVTVSAAVRAERRIRSENGALIVKLSAAAQGIGLQAGDVIVEVNSIPVRDAEAAATLMRRAASRGIRLTVERQGQYGYFSFSVG